MKKENEQKKKKKEKQDFEDDGRTIVDMNVDGFSWYQPRKGKEKKAEDRDKPTKKELGAMILAAYKAYLPYFLILIGTLIAVFFLGMLILR